LKKIIQYNESNRIVSISQKKRNQIKIAGCYITKALLIIRETTEKAGASLFLPRNQKTQIEENLLKKGITPIKKSIRQKKTTPLVNL